MTSTISSLKPSILAGLFGALVGACGKFLSSTDDNHSSIYVKVASITGLVLFNILMWAYTTSAYNENKRRSTVYTIIQINFSNNLWLTILSAIFFGELDITMSKMIGLVLLIVGSALLS